jgi:hypothetical protein
MTDSVTLDIKKRRYAEVMAKRAKWKKRFKIMGGVCVFLALIIYWGIAPRKGGLDYGVCKVYVERLIHYPPTLQIKEVQEFDQSLRIYYTYYDPFGQYKKDLIECVFNTRAGNYTLLDAVINRVPEPASRIESFNMTVPAILAQDLDLIIPNYEDVLRGVVPEDD